MNSTVQNNRLDRLGIPDNDDDPFNYNPNQQKYTSVNGKPVLRSQESQLENIYREIQALASRQDNQDFIPESLRVPLDPFRNITYGFQDPVGGYLPQVRVYYPGLGETYHINAAAGGTEFISPDQSVNFQSALDYAPLIKFARENNLYSTSKDDDRFKIISSSDLSNARKQLSQSKNPKKYTDMSNLITFSPGYLNPLDYDIFARLFPDLKSGGLVKRNFTNPLAQYKRFLNRAM